jgi:putative molybdopterin biosynthesis protein
MLFFPHSGKNSMSEFLTTQELAAMLRVKQRKVYDMVAKGALPVRRVTGKLLFPRSEIEEWIAGKGKVSAPQPNPTNNSPARATVIVGGHDPLLEWACRESRSGIATLLDGALDGLQRWTESDYIAAGLHIPEQGETGWNVATVKKSFGDKPVVLIEWAKRTRGLIYKPGLTRSIGSLASVGKLRFQPRQPESGSELILAQLLKDEGLQKSALNCVSSVERSEMDLAMAIAAGRADAGLGIEAAARQFQLEFKVLIVERFDLLVWRKSYFETPFQTLIRFCRSETFRQRAKELGGYDVSGLGTVYFNGP